MAIPEDHLAKFHKITDAKEMWEATKSIFGGNDESTKMHKYILKQQFKGFSVSNSEGLHKDANQKFLRSLHSSWSQLSLIMRFKPGVDTFCFDDLYNNLRVFASDVNGSTVSSSSTQNVAFVSSDSTNSTNEISTAYGVSTSSGHNSQKEGSSSYTNDLMYSFFANQSSGPQLDYEDLEHVDEFNLEEMDLKWQVAMISTRLKKFYKTTRRKLQFNAKEPVGFDKTKVECLNCHNTGVDWTGHAEDDTEDYALMAFNSSNSGSDTECPKLIQFTCKTTTSQKVRLTISSVEILESVPKPVESKPKAVSKPKFWSDAPIIEEQTVKDQDTCSQNPKVDKRDWTSLKSKRMGLGYGYTKKACFVCGSFSHLIRDCDFHEKRMAKQNKFVPTTILTKTERFPVNAVRQKFSSQAASTNTVRKVNTARPIVNEIKPRNNEYKSYSPIRRPFNRTTTPKVNFANHKVTTARDNTVSVVGGNRETTVKASAGSKGQITGKGNIKTRKLDFEDVYFVKELQHFKLFSVSQMCDKKNKVLFTDIECLVLSPDFKLPDENQVLLRVPRQNNMYSFNLENIVPSGGCGDGVGGKRAEEGDVQYFKSVQGKRFCS
uniref:Ribonuclease H-like domain-containing protein n=1 Tax=Tanacetum cinerariifolium TaxID=118510 RepID=A0A6L2KM90_TANCI|nr:ribonuclease H-like domain-containing protein [Tanacetum cinerariifolium]